MHKEIEIQLYNILSEGEITAKEKEQIIQNGIKLGLDKFEVEMYVENYQINTADTKKCPFCNANIAFISNVCKYCGQELTLKTNCTARLFILALYFLLVYNHLKITTSYLSAKGIQVA